MRENITKLHEDFMKFHESPKENMATKRIIAPKGRQHDSPGQRPGEHGCDTNREPCKGETRTLPSWTFVFPSWNFVLPFANRQSQVPPCGISHKCIPNKPTCK